MFSLPWCTSCTFDHDCPHHLFPGCEIRLFLLFQYPRLYFFFGMHSGQEDDPLVFLWSKGKQGEIVCMVKCVLNCSFICFRQKAVWNARFVLLHRANQSDLSEFQLHGQRNWPVIIVSGNVSACSRNWRNQIQNWQSRCMSATSCGNFGRNQAEGFANNQNIYFDAIFTWFTWYVLLETTPYSESMERFINCATSSWSVVCFTSYDKFVVYVGNRCQLVIGSSLGPRGWIVKA